MNYREFYYKQVYLCGFCQQSLILSSNYKHDANIKATLYTYVCYNHLHMSVKYLCTRRENELIIDMMAINLTLHNHEWWVIADGIVDDAPHLLLTPAINKNYIKDVQLPIEWLNFSPEKILEKVKILIPFL